MSAFDLLVLSLAVWRASYMISSENGPFNAFTILRQRLPLGGLTACIYCVSVWVAIALYLALPTVLAPVVYILAASGGAMMLWRYTGGSHV